MNKFAILYRECYIYLYIYINCYPSKLIDTCIKTFLDKIFCKKPKRCTVPKKEYFIVLPYLGTLSGKIQKQIRNLFQQSIPWGRISLTFKAHSRLSIISV